jgi:hypothetical protein
MTIEQFRNKGDVMTNEETGKWKAFTSNQKKVSIGIAQLEGFEESESRYWRNGNVTAVVDGEF